MNSHEGIIAVSTAAGKSGIGIVRMSGDWRTVGLVMKSMTGIDAPRPRYAHFSEIRDEKGNLIDNGVVIWFKAPNSYTGLDVVEFQTHGNPLILSMVIRAALAIGKSHGLRMAEPGEFTRQAYENGKLDLAMAESVMDLINATSESAVKAAEKSLTGTFSSLCAEIRERIDSLRVNIEAAIDFTEEDIDFMTAQGMLSEMAELQNKVSEILFAAQQGSVLVNGSIVALVGSPNVGKSSLLNRLSGRDVSMVTEIPGTTRDSIESAVLINGIQVTLIDTAGIRETSDLVEREGIKRTISRIKRSDLVMHLVSTDTRDGSGEAQAISRHTGGRAAVITVVNKCDLMENVPMDTGDTVHVSAKTGYGMDRLREKIISSIGISNSDSNIFAARERHLESLRNVQRHLENSEQALKICCHLDLAAEELRSAGKDIGDILGETTADDLLGKIFSAFCIGK